MAGQPGRMGRGRVMVSQLGGGGHLLEEQAQAGSLAGGGGWISGRIELLQDPKSSLPQDLT